MLEYAKHAWAAPCVGELCLVVSDVSRSRPKPGAGRGLAETPEPVTRGWDRTGREGYRAGLMLDFAGEALGLFLMDTEKGSQILHCLVPAAELSFLQESVPCACASASNRLKNHKPVQALALALFKQSY